MLSNDDRFNRAISRFDEENSRDPRREIDGGTEVPYELLYSRRMTRTLDIFEPEASEALRLAARCQHIRRWEIPRDRYPMDRTGYKRWRNELARFHTRTATQILQEVGYDEPTISRVSDLLLKKGLKTDPEVQTLEDVICLVFLQYYFHEFAQKHPEEKTLDIVRKTWKKMSDRGHKAALNLKLPPEDSTLLEKALV